MVDIIKEQKYEELNIDEMYDIEHIILEMQENPLTKINFNGQIVYGTSDDLERDLLRAIDSIDTLDAPYKILSIKKSIEKRISRNLARIDENDIIFKYCLGLAKEQFIEKEMVEEFERVQVFRYEEDDNSLRLMISLLQATRNLNRFDKDNGFLNLFNSINTEKEHSELKLALSLIKNYTQYCFIIDYYLNSHTLNELKHKQKQKLEVLDALPIFRPNK